MEGVDWAPVHHTWTRIKFPTSTTMDHTKPKGSKGGMTVSAVAGKHQDGPTIAHSKSWLETDNQIVIEKMDGTLEGNQLVS